MMISNNHWNLCAHIHHLLDFHFNPYSIIQLRLKNVNILNLSLVALNFIILSLEFHESPDSLNLYLLGFLLAKALFSRGGVFVLLFAVVIIKHRASSMLSKSFTTELYLQSQLGVFEEMFFSLPFFYNDLTTMNLELDFAPK